LAVGAQRHIEALNSALDGIGFAVAGSAHQ
jgi:hypothetical protein